MWRSRGLRARRGTARAVRVVVLRTIWAREARCSARADTCRVTSPCAVRFTSARRTTSRVVISSTVSGTVSTTVAAGATGWTTVAAGTAGCTMVEATAGATDATTGRRVTMVPAGVWVTVVSTGSAVIVRVI